MGSKKEKLQNIKKLQNMKKKPLSEKKIGPGLGIRTEGLEIRSKPSSFLVLGEN